MSQHRPCVSRVLLLCLLVGFVCIGTAPTAEAQRSRRKPKTIDYYEVLELGDVREAATLKQIKKNFRRLSKLYHPDVAKTDEDKAKYGDVNNAYDVLTDKKKRKMYDMRGEEGLQLLKEYERGSAADNNPFGQIFGAFGMGEGGASSLKGKNVEVTVKLDLAKVFSGGESELNYVKLILCKACKGKGADHSHGFTRCDQCSGTGTVVQHVMLGPNTVQEVRQHCPQCSGTGKRPKHVCPSCQGGKLEKGQGSLKLEIERGMPEGHTVVFELEANESPDVIPGDVILHLKSGPHPLFSRRHNDIDMDTSIAVTLKEALLGFKRTILHVDGKEEVEVEQVGVTAPGSILKIPGKGMYKYHSDKVRGDLYVKVNVTMPTLLSSSMREELDKVLD